jgi:hypothetical protein
LKLVPKATRFLIPDYKYICPSAWRPHNAFVELARLRLLQACDRLNIEVELGRIEFHIAPDTGGTTLMGNAFALPDLHMQLHSEAEWKREASRLFEKECEDFLEWYRSDLKKSLASGRLVPVKQRRTGGKNAPLETRYEWAAKRYVQDMDYKDIAKGTTYRPGQVKEAVREILKEAKLIDK